MDGAVRTTMHGELAVVTTTGDVDIEMATPLREELARITDDTDSDVLVDLTQAIFMDSTGMGVLMAALRKLRVAGRTMELAVHDERVLHVLRICGLSDAFVVHRGVDEAMAARRTPPRGTP